MRLWNWSERLEDVVIAHRTRAFSWGESDCLQFAGSCVEAVRGDNPAAEYRGTYSDEAGAAKILLKLGVRDAPGMLASLFAQRGGVLNAQRGDLAALREPSGDDPFGATGVVLGSGIVAGYGPGGLEFLSLTSATRVFAVE
jgi:hypothetical protein